MTDYTEAHRAVLQFCHQSNRMLTTTGATIQRIGA